MIGMMQDSGLQPMANGRTKNVLFNMTSFVVIIFSVVVKSRSKVECFIVRAIDNFHSFSLLPHFNDEHNLKCFQQFFKM